MSRVKAKALTDDGIKLRKVKADVVSVPQRSRHTSTSLNLPAAFFSLHFFSAIIMTLGYLRLLSHSVSSEGLDPRAHPHAMKTSPVRKLAMGRHPKMLPCCPLKFTHAAS